jgi:hypothetical protein
MARKKKQVEDKELTLEDAQNVIRRLAHPKHVNQEDKLLKEAAAVVLKETQPEFEFGDDEEEDVNIDSANAVDTTSELTKPPGFLEQLGAQAAAVGPAGLIALSSAAYFQIDTVVEETRVVQSVAEEKWEEVKFEHPNINWDDPLAGFTTILGMGDIEIDLDPPTPPTQPEPKETNEPSKLPKGAESDGEETQEKEVSEEPTEPSDKSDTKDEDSNEEAIEEEKEEPKKKKKGFFAKLLSGDDEEEAEEPEEESEPEAETEEPEEVEEEPEPVEEESNESEPEAEEPVDEQPKKKRGLFSFLTGGGDDDDEPDSEEQGEPTQDGDTIPDEQAAEESTEEPETETSESEVDGTEPATEPVANAGPAESNGVKKSSGGGLLSLFGFNNSEKEVDEQSEISTDEEPAIEVAEIDSETEAPPISNEEPEIEVDDISIDEIDDIKPHTMVTETEIEVAPEVDIADVIVNAEVVIDDIEVDAGIEIADLSIDDIIEETIVEAEELPLVFTPNDGVIIVSPSNQLYASTNFN